VALLDARENLQDAALNRAALESAIPAPEHRSERPLQERRMLPGAFLPEAKDVVAAAWDVPEAVPRCPEATDWAHLILRAASTAELGA
jgi:hypothetical protein